MSDYLECDGCGGEAIFAHSDGLFWDGDADSCLTCGHPGGVSVKDGKASSGGVDLACGPACHHDAEGGAIVSPDSGGLD